MNSSSTPTVGVVDSWRPAVDSVEQVAPMLASTRSVEGGNRPEEAPFSSGERGGLWSALPTSRKRQRVLAHRMNLGTGVPRKTYCVGLGKTRPPQACLTPPISPSCGLVRTPFAESRIMTWRPAVVQSRFYPWGGRRYRADSENYEPI